MVQPGKKINEYEHPRTIDVRNYLKLHEKTLFHSKGGAIVKRRMNRAMRVYTLSQFEDIHQRLFKAGGELDFRLRVDILLGHFMLLRSKNRLEMELGDLSMLVQQFEGIRGPVNMLYALLQDVKVHSILTLTHSRNKRWEIIDMAMCFDTKNLSFALSALLPFIFGYDLILMEKHGLSFMMEINGKAFESSRTLVVPSLKSSRTLRK